MTPKTPLVLKVAVLTAFSLIATLRVAPQPSIDNEPRRVQVLQIPLPAPSAEMKERIANLLESIPPVRLGWLDSFPVVDDKVYIHGGPFDRSVVDILVQATEAGGPSEPMWPGLRREFPAEVKEEILAGGPAAIEALISIMIDEMESPYLEVPAVLIALWDRLSSEQKDMYLRHHIHPYVGMKPRYEQGSREWIRAGAEARLSWPSTQPHPIPEATTEVFVDGRLIAQRGTNKTWDEHRAGVVRMGRAFNIVPVDVSELALGPHTIRAVTTYTFVCEGRAYTGEADSGDRPFEIVQPFMPNQLAAAPGREIDRLVEKAFVIKEIDPQPIWSEEENELVAWAPQLVPGPGEKEGYAIHMPVYRVARDLPVDLAFEVEYHLLDNGDVVQGSPVKVRKGMGGSGSFGFRSANPNADRQQFISDRDGYVPLRIILTPSEQVAKDYGLTDYYDRPITVENLRARVHRFDLAAVNEIKQYLEEIVSELQSSLQISDREAKQLSRVARDLERGSAAAIINLRGSPDNLDTAVVPFLVRLLDVPEVGFMDSIPRNAMDQLVWIGAPAVETLRKTLENESAQTRKYAALGLKAMGTPKAHEALLSARDSADAEVRAIAESMNLEPATDDVVDVPDPVLRQAIRKALRKDSDSFTRQEIAEARLARLYVESRPGGVLCKNLEGIDACRDLTSLTIAENALQDIGPVSALTKLIEFRIERGTVSDFSPLASLKRLERLRIAHNPVADLEFMAELTSLRYEVELIELNISDLRPLTGLTGFSKLDLQDNAITDVSPLASLEKLYRVNLGGNPLRNVRPLKQAPNLSWLGLARTGIQDVEFVSDMVKLGGLDVGHTDVTDLRPVAKAPALKGLAIDGLRIDNLEALANARLTGISFSETEIADLSRLSSISTLKSIRAANARIRDIGVFRTLNNLETLYLPGNAIEDLSPIADLKMLSKLNASGNRIADARPIAGLTRLTEIDLSDNRIAMLPAFDGMTGLRNLRLYNNRIVDIEPLLILSPSTQVLFMNNLLNCESIEEHIPALEARGIHVLYSGFCISSVEPSSAPAGKTVKLTFSVRGNMGTLFYPVGDGGYYPKSIYLGRDGADGIQAENFRIVDENRVDCTFSLGSAPHGIWDLHVDINERLKGALIGAFTIR